MHRFAILRIVLLASFISLISLIGLGSLWFLLPSSRQFADSNPLSISKDLLSGAPLTTVHQYQRTTFYEPGPDSLGRALSPLNPPKNAGWWDALIYEWRLGYNSVGGDILLTIGRPQGLSFPDDFGATANLTKLAKLQPQFIKEGLSFWASAGNRDSFLMPDFSVADAALLYHQAMESWQSVYLRLLVPEAGVVQIWTNMPGWDDFEPSRISLIDDEDRTSGLIATFNFTEVFKKTFKPRIEDIEVSFREDVLLPSRTWPIRRQILSILLHLCNRVEFLMDSILLPILFVVWELFKLTIILGLVYMLTVYTCWCLLGRGTPFGKWTKNFWLSKHISRRLLGAPPTSIWGPTGPLNEDDFKSSDRLSRARPLSSPVGFFTSKSPLDDLLMTFEATRWMLRPIGQKLKVDDNPPTDQKRLPRWTTRNSGKS